LRDSACSIFDPALADSISRRARLAGHLLSATVELTRMCNLRCIMCYATRTASRAELTDAQVRGAFRGLRRCGVLFLMLSGGEPAVRPSFFSLLEDAAGLGFSITLLTNATLLDRDACRRLAGCARLARVSVSIYGTTAKTHDGVTRVRGSFNRTRRAVSRLAELGMDVILKFLIMRQNEREIDVMPEFARELGLPFQVDTIVTARDDGDPAPLQFRVGEEAIVRTLRIARDEQRRIVAEQECALTQPSRGREERNRGADVRHGQAAARAIGKASSPTYHLADKADSALDGPCAENAKLKRNRGPLCAAGASYCIVNAYGDCCPCPQMPISQGSILRTPLARIWRTGKLFRALRTLRQSKLPVCRKCSIAKHCRRCPGLALTEAGSIYLPSETACREASAWQRVKEGHSVV
jgi:radical SAM protein with 4Fe4S-binding SPASM domain